MAHHNNVKPQQSQYTITTTTTGHSMGQQTEDSNEWADYTIQELRDLRDNLDDRLDMLNAEPVSYYSAGYADTYLSAMSQVWGIQVCREERDAVVAEIDRRRDEQEEAEDEVD